jgi:hypothetical protein
VTRMIAVVTEARADFITATELADRVLLEEISWLEPDLLFTQRQWVNEERPDQHLYWSSISRRARELGIRAHGHFNHQPGMPDARAARLAILYILRQFTDVDAIVLIRDQDDQAERRVGLEQARNGDKSGKTVVIGVAKCERESWVLCGFEPQDHQEQQILDLERKKLGMNPCLRSHELHAGKNDQAIRSPKRVLAALTDGHWEREAKCWRETPLQTLRNQGEDNGLTEFLDEVTLHLVPLLSGPAGKA